MALRDVLADVSARLGTVEGRSIEQAPNQLAPCTHTAPTPAHSGSRHWPLHNLRNVHGWTQTGLMARMRTVATGQGLRLPEPSSLKTMISRWEHGAPVSDFYDGILTAVFADTPDPAPADDLPVAQWTGRTANALRMALRMTHETFAQTLGVSVRGVCKWSAEPNLIPVTEMQAALDTLLSRASGDEKSRFRLITATAGITATAVAA